MAMIDGWTWLELLSTADCWKFLGSTPVGRIGVLNDSAPEIYPVNHVPDGETIVFRTDPGSKLRASYAAQPSATRSTASSLSTPPAG